jgi:hypothetical protein
MLHSSGENDMEEERERGRGSGERERNKSYGPYSQHFNFFVTYEWIE